MSDYKTLTPVEVSVRLHFDNRICPKRQILKLIKTVRICKRGCDPLSVIVEEVNCNAFDRLEVWIGRIQFGLPRNLHANIATYGCRFEFTKVVFDAMVIRAKFDLSVGVVS